MKKRAISFFVALMLLVSAVMLSSCSSDAPELERVKDRFIYLIEESKEFNVIFFGKGLPVYKRDSTLAEEKGVYYVDEYTSYDEIMKNAGYISIDQIKMAAEKIYSENYLSSLYESAFDGVMVGSGSAYLRFYETDSNFYQNSYATDFELSERIYDYSTMQIVDPSDSEYVNVSIDSYTVDNRKVETVYLTFVNERGNWYIDSPTY